MFIFNGDKIMTEQEKLDYLSKHFALLNEDGKDYLDKVSQQLLSIQYPAIPPPPLHQREYKAHGVQSGGEASLLC
jgi:hypothetical protein